jgi:hypothetical protein
MFFPMRGVFIWQWAKKRRNWPATNVLSGGRAVAHMSSFVWKDQTEVGQDESPRNTRIKKYIFPHYHGHVFDLRAHLTSRSFCSRRLRDVEVLTKHSHPIRVIIASLPPPLVVRQHPVGGR